MMEIKQCSKFLFHAADIGLAQQHALASRVTVFKADETSQSICPCCGHPYKGPGSEQYPLHSDHFNDLCALGLAFPCFFALEAYLVYGVFLIALSVGIPSFVLSLLVGRQTDYGNYSLLAEMSIGGYGENPHERSLTWCWGLNVVGMIILYSTLIAASFKLRDIVQKSLITVSTQANYSVRVEGLGKDWDEEALKAHIQQAMHLDTEVAEITPSYELVSCWKLIRKYERLQTFAAAKDLEELPELSNCQSEISSLIPTISKTGVAFVSFSSLKSADEFKDKWSRSWLKSALINKIHHGRGRLFKDNRIIITEACEPTDIIWEHLHVSRRSWLLRQCLTYTILAVILGVSFVALYYIAEMQRDVKNRLTHDIWLDASSVISSILTLLFNLSLEKTIRFLSAYESHMSYTNQERAIAHKLTFSKALNTLLWPLVTHTDTDTWFVPQGLASNIFWLSIALAFVNPIVGLFCSPVVWWRYFRRQYLVWSIRTKRRFVSQKEANSAFEYREPDVARWFTDLNVKILFIAAYTPLMPIITPIMAAGLLLDYWAIKVNLLRLSRRPKCLNEKIAYVMVGLTKLAFVIYGVSIYVFFTTVDSDFQIGGICSIIFGCALCVFPICCLHKKLPNSERSGTYWADKRHFVTVSDTQTYKQENIISALQESLAVSGGDSMEAILKLQATSLNNRRFDPRLSSSIGRTANVNGNELSESLIA